MMPEAKAQAHEAPATAKERAQRVAQNFATIVDNLSEAQCQALEKTGILNMLRRILSGVRAGQILPDMSIGEIGKLLQTLVLGG